MGRQVLHHLPPPAANSSWLRAKSVGRSGAGEALLGSNNASRRTLGLGGVFE